LKHAFLLLAFALPAALGGCREEYPGTLSRERFVAVNVALRRLDAAGRAPLRTAADSGRARAAVLKKEGVTEKELQAFVDARRNDTEELSEAWREVAVRLARADSAARADSVRRDSLARAAKKDTTAAARRDTARRTPPAPPGRTIPAPAPGARPEDRPGPAPVPPGTPQPRS
jgi:septal ring factor EnvC (AmiA/AmiB activator)